LQEAFVKICEQAKAYLNMKGELVSGLNLINNTNLEFFPVKNKAEIFRLKGDFMLKMNDCENANVAYSNAITLFKHLPKGWISWGNYCDMVWFYLYVCNATSVSKFFEYNYDCFAFCRFSKKQMKRFGLSMLQAVFSKASNMEFRTQGVI
jgi:transformation/transcription domain-associated protein